MVFVSFRVFYPSALHWWISFSASGTRYFYLRHPAWDCELRTVGIQVPQREMELILAEEELVMVWPCCSCRRHLWVSGTCISLPFCWELQAAWSPSSIFKKSSPTAPTSLSSLELLSSLSFPPPSHISSLFTFHPSSSDSISPFLHPYGPLTPSFSLPHLS